MNDAKLFSALPRFPALLVAAAALVAPSARGATLGGDAATDLDVMTIIDGLAEPMDVAVLPDGRLVIAQRLGDIAVGLPGGGQADEHINVVTEGDVFGEQGVLGVVADPNFTTNHYLYFFVSMGTDAQSRHKIVRYVLGDDNVLSEQLIIVDMGLIGTNNHNGGGLNIDGNHLYISLGDTGNNATPPQNKFGTCLNKANGKILRVNLDGTIPADNPLVGVAMVTGCTNWDQDLMQIAPDERVYAWGLRNPFRFWVDPETKKLWIGDVGESAEDEISIGDKGTHFGWPFFEGAVEYDQQFKPAEGCMGVTPATACTAPAHSFGHMAGRNAVIGGLILDICTWPEAWRSRYVFGDHGPNPGENANAWTLDVNGTRDALVSTAETEFGRFAGPGAFRVGPDNALYVVEHNGGAVQRITPKQAIEETCATPVGGAGGAGGMPGVGGSPGTGGSGGSPAAGGTPGASGGTPGASGSTAPSGTGGTANPATPSAAAAADDGGCGCRVARTSGVPAGMVLFAGALGLLWGRRRRSRAYP